MKKIAFICLMLIFSISLLQAGTIANVIGHKNLLLTIDRGSSDGVELGMKGIVKAVYKEPSGEYTINIGIFTVKKLFPRSTEVIIEIGKGLSPDDAQYVVFDQDLISRQSKVEPATEIKTKSTAQTKPIDNIDSLLDKGDREAEAGNAQAALQLYQKALAQAPGNMIAKEKCNEMQKEIDTLARQEKFTDYLKKSAVNYEKNDIKFSFLYLIEGLRIFPEGRTEVKERLSMMNREYPREIETIMAEKAQELKDVRNQIDAMLGKTEAAKPAAVQVKTQGIKYNEPFLQRISAKTEQIRKNEKGFWEATFPHNITMIYVPEGEFTIGSPDREGENDEHPAHRVFISGYWIGKTEVTFTQFDAFCQETGLEKPKDQGWGRGERPVINISWQQANDFCAWLKKKTGLAFRLLSEAEWEKAARDHFPWGNADPQSQLANFNQQIMKTAIVGSYPEGASPYGVLDMAGNVWEWLSDWYGEDYYENSSANDPTGPKYGAERVVRGGSWDNGADLIRSAVRGQENPESKLNIIGFRLALSDSNQQADAMLGKTEAAKPTAVQVKTQGIKYNEPFLQRISAKTEQIRKNEKGFWEATFPHNITMIYVPEGEFTIGSPDREGENDEHPAHRVFISGYWIGKTEVTFTQFDAFCQETGLEKPKDQGWGRGERPVINISWQQANDFCAWLKKKTGLAFRLLSEVEWEKAARDHFPWGNADPQSQLANFNQQIMKTAIVGSYPEGASPYGVLDMAGNVWEWLSDWYGEDYYENSSASDPAGPKYGAERVVRGGSWDNGAALIRSAVRGQENPESKLNIIGFRLALSGK